LSLCREKERPAISFHFPRFPKGKFWQVTEAVSTQWLRPFQRGDCRFEKIEKGSAGFNSGRERR